jgi:hypothetical protein
MPTLRSISVVLLHVVRVGTARTLSDGAIGCPVHHLGRVNIPSAATASAGRQSWSSASSGTTIPTRLVGLP